MKCIFVSLVWPPSHLQLPTPPRSSGTPRTRCRQGIVWITGAESRKVAPGMLHAGGLDLARRFSLHQIE